jgi:hypothetical protein
LSVNASLTMNAWPIAWLSDKMAGSILALNELSRNIFGDSDIEEIP